MVQRSDGLGRYDEDGFDGLDAEFLLNGPVHVKGIEYAGKVPMISFNFLTDEEIAGVITYVRNSFGNKASVVSPQTITKLRAATKNQLKMYSPEQLLKAHPQ